MFKETSIFLSWFVCALMFCGALSAAEYKATVSPDRENGIYKVGEPITFLYKVTQDGKDITGKIKLRKLLKCDGRESATETFDSDGSGTVKTSLPIPGRAYLELGVLGEDGKMHKGAGAACGAMADPFEIRAGRAKPADFDAFWDKERARLLATPYEAKLKPLTELLPGKPYLPDSYDYYEFELPTMDGLPPATGLFTIPKNAKPGSLGIIVNFPVAYFGPHKGVMQGDPKLMVAYLNVHGTPNQGHDDAFYMELRKTSGYDTAWANSNPENLKQYYYYGVFLRVMRLLDYLASRPEWNGKELRVQGSSQGGGLSLVAAGLDSRVSNCYSLVPALSDHAGIEVKRQSGWPQFLNIKEPELRKKALAASSYFDTANFATRIKCPVLIATGFADDVCSAASVFAAFNNLPDGIEKTITVDPNGGHGTAGKYTLKNIVSFPVRN
jgi:cephalosporin-C deacetylase-like acetyl esterase